ncbi:hypothetical protein TI06_23365, partial [Vibrio vulnificus]
EDWSTCSDSFAGRAVLHLRYRLGDPLQWLFGGRRWTAAAARRATAGGVGEAHRGFLPGPVDGLQAVVALFLGLVATQRAEVR